MPEYYKTLLILGLGFLLFFLIIRYGPYLFDLLFYQESKDADQKENLRINS